VPPERFGHGLRKGLGGGAHRHGSQESNEKLGPPAQLAPHLDIEGAADVDLRFAALAGTATNILVDLSQITSLASIGIRTLLVNAKVVHRRGGKLVLAAPQPMVEKVLRTAGIPELVPMHPDIKSAMRQFGG
jgi:anti-sigma B factor antagonist